MNNKRKEELLPAGNLMKQEMITFLSQNQSILKNLCTFLYDNPEESYKEFKSSSYICDLLTKYSFKVTSNYLDIPSSFYAVKGTGHPKICYLCEYDAIANEGHLTGHNALTTMSIGASILLGSIINKTGGSVVVIGCPGEYLGGTKNIMVKQKSFEDIDVVMECHPDIVTAESGTSSSIIPLSIKYTNESTFSFLSRNKYTSLDAMLLIFNIVNNIKKGLPKDVEINSIISSGGSTPLFTPSECEAKFYIRAKNTKMVEVAEEKIRKTAAFISEVTDIPHTISLYEPPSENLITNRTLNRLFSHNLKENGVISINSPANVFSGLSIGAVSKVVPAIHPYISIIEQEGINYGSKEFLKATQSSFAFEQMKKASLALAFTGMDLIHNNNLLNEIRNEFYKDIEQE